MFGSQNSVMLILCALTITIFWLIWRDIGKTKKLLGQDKKIEEMNEFCNSRLNNINNSVNQYREECVNLLQHALPPPQHPHIQQVPPQPGMEVDSELDEDANVTSLDASYQEFKENNQDIINIEEDQSKLDVDDNEEEDLLKLSEQDLEDLDNLPDPQDDNEQLSEIDDIEEVNDEELGKPNKLDFGNNNEDSNEESDEDELDVTMKLKKELADLHMEDANVEVDDNEVNLDDNISNKEGNEEEVDEVDEEEGDEEEGDEEEGDEEEGDEEEGDEEEGDEEEGDEEDDEVDEEGDEDEDEEPIEVDREYLIGLSKSELSEISKEYGLKSRGNKSELIDRIMLYLEAEAEKAE